LSGGLAVLRLLGGACTTRSAQREQLTASKKLPLGSFFIIEIQAAIDAEIQIQSASPGAPSVFWLICGSKLTAHLLAHLALAPRACTLTKPAATKKPPKGGFSAFQSSSIQAVLK
jgi:hypothetical protein